MPIFSSPCEVVYKTEQICISWLKPEGGNEIDNYTLQWIVIEDNLKYSHSITYNGMKSNNYTIKSLQPAHAVNVSLRASNSAGEGKAFSKIYTTGGCFLYRLQYSWVICIHFICKNVSICKVIMLTKFNICCVIF